MKTNGKGVFFVMIGSVIVLVVLYFLIKSIIKQVGKTETEKANEDEVDNVNNELSDSCSGNYTFDDSAYLTKANTLHDALDGCGTDDSEIDSVFQSLTTRCDVLAVISKYGVREKSCWWGSGQYNLRGALQSDNVLERVNCILCENGVGYQFA